MGAKKAGKNLFGTKRKRNDPPDKRFSDENKFMDAKNCNNIGESSTTMVTGNC